MPKKKAALFKTAIPNWLNLSGRLHAAPQKEGAAAFHPVYRPDSDFTRPKHNESPHSEAASKNTIRGPVNNLHRGLLKSRPSGAEAGTRSLRRRR